MHPAKADGQKEMLYGRDICVVPGNIVLDRGPSPAMGGEIWGSERLVSSDASHRQITLALIIVVIL